MSPSLKRLRDEQVAARDRYLLDGNLGARGMEDWVMEELLGRTEENDNLQDLRRTEG
jgi:hypothetical protein